ncbi:hypothetical protein Trydic_g16702 [Trypoxylus dichotomus]
MHLKRVTVWSEFWDGGVAEPIFFEGAIGNAQTVNGERYWDTIIQFSVARMNSTNLKGMWFQEDGATCHASRETLVLLYEAFSGCVVFCSCDLMLLDFFL